MTTKQSARLRNWQFHRLDGGNILTGRVYGHPRFVDGDEITTSRIVVFRPDLGIAETLNTVYILRDTEEEGDVLRKWEIAA